VTVLGGSWWTSRQAAVEAGWKAGWVQRGLSFRTKNIYMEAGWMQAIYGTASAWGLGPGSRVHMTLLCVGVDAVSCA